MIKGTLKCNIIIGDKEDADSRIRFVLKGQNQRASRTVIFCSDPGSVHGTPACFKEVDRVLGPGTAAYRSICVELNFHPITFQKGTDNGST